MHMRKSVITAVLLFAVSIANAQFIDLGVKSGVQYSTDPMRLSVTELPGGVVPNAGYNTTIGGFIAFNFNRLSITPEFLFSSTYFIPQGSFGWDDVALFNNNRFDLPLVFGYEFFNFLRVEAGPNFYNIKDTESEALFRLKHLDKTFTLGAALDFKKIDLGVRMVNDFDEILNMQENTWQFTLAYKLF